MRIISWNVNGLRAVERKGDLGFFLEKHNPDIFLIQEIKAQEDQVKNLEEKYPEYKKFYHSAEKKGYSGTGIWVKKTCKELISSEKKPLEFWTGMPDYDDNEGRISRVDYKNISVLGVYFPNGGKSEEAWEDKLVFYEKFLKYINKLRKDGRTVIWAGDVNCAHQEIDLARPKDNNGKIGFHPKERAWLDKVINQNWVDVWRKINPTKTEIYSWWHVITRARSRNVGWRLDYFFIDNDLFNSVNKIEYLNNQMGSDHCPILIEIKITE